MIIRLYPENNALPIGPAVNRVGSALPLRIVGAPSGATAVAVSVFNADGAACNLDATLRGGEWVATVPASHFASWGKVARGLQVAVSYKDETDTTQTVVFVGDVRIEKAAAGDPEGTGVRSVPVTEVDEVAAGSSMKDIRDKVNELARIVSGTATALVLMALPLSAATPLEDIPGTNEVYTAAETDLAISNAIAQIPPPAAGISTNDVCAIVTNEVVYSYFSNPAYNPEWNVEQTTATFTISNLTWNGGTVRYVCNGEQHEIEELDTFTIVGRDRDVYLYVPFQTERPIPVNSTPDQWMLFIGTEGGFDGDFTTYFVAQKRNALGFARLVDLPPITNGIPEAIATKATTNDVFDIVTNEVVEWVYEGLPEGAVVTMPPKYIQSQGFPWEMFFSVGGTDYAGNNLTYDAELNPVEFMCFDIGVDSTNFTVTATLKTSNALGLAREKDLPNKTPVDEILLNGADGKVYHLRIGAGGSVDIYTEVVP